MNGFSFDNGGGDAYMDHTGSEEVDHIMMMGQDNGVGALGGQSLDDIVSQNAKAMRRQSMPQSYGATSNAMMHNMQPMSGLDYSSTSSMNHFQFPTGAAMDQAGMMNSGMTPQRQQASSSLRRQQSGTDISLDTNFNGHTAQNFSPMVQPASAFASPANSTSGMEIAMNSPYLNTGMGIDMDYGVDPGMNNSLAGDGTPMSLYSQPQFRAQSTSSPSHSAALHQGGSPSGSLPARDAIGRGGISAFKAHSRRSSSNRVIQSLARSNSLQIPKNHQHGSSPMSAPPLTQEDLQKSNDHRFSHSGFESQPQHPTPGSRQDLGMNIGQPPQPKNYDGINGPIPVDIEKWNPNNQGFDWEPRGDSWPSTMVGRSAVNTAYKNAYSSTGFDMLGVLARVATRPNPEINIGLVDLSCAFVVCDAEKDDFPIVYCSDNFERLTGYTKHMILGRNCRFLQSPDGNVSPGVTRKYVDDNSVLYLKNMINLRRESQISLINYRRGGQPFMNLLTMIPISWETDQVKFFVGFQVDLVEQPNAVTDRNPDGSYAINYQRGMMPRYVLNPAESSSRTELGQTISQDDVSAILSVIGSGESEYAKRMWDKLLLENTDDVVHVLSLKGLFQWVSPSALRVLEYEPSEIIGTALSSICHPSDIVPVTRELKDTSSGASVNVVFRIRRKNSGYMWFEGHGSLHTEQGKGRKSIIMVGRERPVYTLSRTDIQAAGGIGETEFWTKMSTSGMFLFVSAAVRQLLDRQPEELVGISIQSLMRTDSKGDFGRILEHARIGKKASVKHEMINRRGQVLAAFTTLYPGDATEGHKPTFIISQTRLIKSSRTQFSSRPVLYPKAERTSQDSTQSNSVAASADRSSNNTETALQRYINTNGSAATYAGSSGLVIGRQDQSLASEDNLFEELKTTKSSSWQYEIRQLEKRNRLLAEEVQALIAAKKKRKRRKGAGISQKDCANCHTRVTPEWRRGPSGQRDLCNSCGLRWAKLNGRVSPRTSSQHSVASDKASKASASPNQRMDSSPQYPPSAIAAAAAAAASSKDGKTAQKPPEGYSAQMEGASGVPAKIEEGVEPL